MGLSEVAHARKSHVGLASRDLAIWNLAGVTGVVDLRLMGCWSVIPLFAPSRLCSWAAAGATLLGSDWCHSFY